ncbi:MAG: hypothetical protein QXF12_05330 [Candidatus Aenigmatarchaeota archaeon]
MFLKSQEYYISKKYKFHNDYISMLKYYINKIRPDVDSNIIVKELFKNYFKDLKIFYFQRTNGVDREIKIESLFDFISDKVNSNLIIAPTFTTYLSKDVKKSILSEFIEENVKLRSQAKKEAYKAKEEGNMDLYVVKNNEQNNMKIYNNSLSGAFAQESSMLYNPTGHSTLTSITRTITSLSNASNERFIAGNRNYQTLSMVLNDIVYSSYKADKDLISNVISRYSLHVPSVEDILNILRRSYKLYFLEDNKVLRYLKGFLDRTEDEERCSIAYCLDFYHLRVYNEKLVRKMISELISICYNDYGYSLDKLVSLDDSIQQLISCIFYDEIMKYGKNYEVLHKENIAPLMYNTAINIIQTLTKYEDLFKAFYLRDVFPYAPHRLKNMIRRAVVLSDTDSTCFTLDEWIRWWYNEDFKICRESISITGVLSYLATKVIENQLALLSANMNIHKDDLFKLKMKNEFLWTVHVPQEVSKHYFALTVMQEGVVFKKPEIEIKGVHLKNSALPRWIIEDSKELMNHILTSVHDNKKISITNIIKRVSDIEKLIEKSILQKQDYYTYLKKSKIKSKEAYTLDEKRSPYRYHLMWNYIFGPKYGYFQDPPYDVYKIPTIIDGKTSILNWLNSIKESDIELYYRIISFMKDFDFDSFSTFYISESYAQGNPIPKEIISIINTRRIILDITIQHRMILESLGLRLEDELLISEMFNI